MRGMHGNERKKAVTSRGRNAVMVYYVKLLSILFAAFLPRSTSAFFLLFSCILPSLDFTSITAT